MSTLGKWHLEIQIYCHPHRPGFNTLWLRDAIRRRWEDAGRPDEAESLAGLAVNAVDSLAWWFDPARLEEMKASVKLRRERP